MKALKIMAALAVLALATACGNTAASNTGTSTTPAATTATAPAAPTFFKVGDTVKVGEQWQVIIEGVKTSQGGEFEAPGSGNTYLLVDISLKNLTNQEQDMSSELFWSLQDATGQKYTETVITTAPSTPDGKVAAGGLLRGTIVYKVPTSQHSFSLAFAPDLTSGGQTVWKLTI